MNKIWFQRNVWYDFADHNHRNRVILDWQTGAITAAVFTTAACGKIKSIPHRFLAGEMLASIIYRPKLDKKTLMLVDDKYTREQEITHSYRKKVFSYKFLTA